MATVISSGAPTPPLQRPPSFRELLFAGVRRQPVWIWLALAGVSVAALILAYFTVPESQVSLAKVTASATTGAKLKAWMQPPLSRVDTGSPLPLVVYFSNEGDTDLSVSLQLENTPGCEQTPSNTAQFTVKAHQQSNASVVMDGAKCGVEERQGVPLVIRYIWHDAAAVNAGSGVQTLPTSEGIFSTSPIVFLDGFDQFRDHAILSLKSLYSAVKDLIWPLVLAFFGFLLQSYAAFRAEQETRRTEKQQEEETKRSREQEAAQTRRAERQEVLTHLLPEYLKRVQAHYLPISRRIQTVETEWVALAQTMSTNPLLRELYTASPQFPEVDVFTRTLSAIVLMRRRVQYLGLKEGGVFFRTSIGEALFDECISEFFEQCRMRLGIDAFESAANALDPEATVSDAIELLFGLGRTANVAAGLPIPVVAGVQIVPPRSPI